MGILFLVFTMAWSAIPMELGASYSYKKTSFDVNNYVESESPSVSLSFYLFEKLALEFSYTRGTAVKHEWAGTGYLKRTTSQVMDVTGADLIFVMTSNRKAFLQPYLKGGVAHVKKRQTIIDEGLAPYEINNDPTVSPSYGVGVKFIITDTLGIRASWDVVQTPVEGSSTPLFDSTGKVGLTWQL